MFKNYLYISENKIDLYFSQLTTDKSHYEVTGGIKTGIVNFEVKEKNDSKDADNLLTKLQQVLNEIDNKKLVGDYLQNRQFFKLTYKCKSWLDGNFTLWGGEVNEGENKTYIGFIGSSRYLLKIDNKQFGQFNTLFGEVGYYVGILKNRFDKLNTVDYNLQKEDNSELIDSEVEKKAIQKKAYLNSYSRWMTKREIRNSPSIIEKIFRILFWKVFTLVCGKELSMKKKYYLHRQIISELENRSNLSYNDLETLQSLKGMVKYLDEKVFEYEIVGLKLIDGFHSGNRVILGTPLYVSRIL